MLTSIHRGNPRQPSIVFMHYLGGSARTWLPVMDKLQHKYHCIALDMPGFGDSAHLSPADIDAQANQVRQTLAAKGIIKPWLVGHSMTGKLAAVMGLQQPEALAGVILVAPSPLTPQPMSEQQFLQQRDWQPTLAHAQAFVSGSHVKPLTALIEQQTIEDVLKANPEAFTFWAVKASQEDFGPQFATTELPAMLLLGSADENVPKLDQQIAMTLKHFVGYEYQLLDGCGHLLPLEATDDVVHSIDKFCAIHR